MNNPSTLKDELRKYSMNMSNRQTMKLFQVFQLLNIIIIFFKESLFFWIEKNKKRIFKNCSRYARSFGKFLNEITNIR